MKLLQGDCLDLMAKLEDNSIDMVLADLPFGTTRQKWDKVIDMNALWEQYNRIVKDDGAIVLFAKPPFDKVLACSNLKTYRYDWIWEKTRATGHLNAGRMPMQAHEYLCVFYKRQPYYNPQKTKGNKPVNKFYTRKSGECYGGADKVKSGGGSTERHPRSVVKHAPVPNKERRHSNQKPLSLLLDMIKTYSKIGDVILDNTMGSGSVGEACLLTGRNFIGMEKTPLIFMGTKKHLLSIQSAV
ncbi:DNA-methyltransferase [Psychromonas ossibalaenae]|uniref:DNA-methyltransferase n=1 Tax=Psychromonas ossibalaenae TaxID=444922 RepID=UPI00036A17E4|nr:site-specific DNA-methyltransferase [Psychromonas ossibalaenae]